MSEKAKQLLDAQVAFHLSQLQGDALNSLINNEIDQLREWLSSQNIEQFIDRKRLEQIFDKLIVDLELPQSLTDSIADLVKQLAFSEQWGEWQVRDLVDEESFHKIVDQAVALESVRNEIIHRAMHSEIYSDMISDVVYHAIKDYMVEENIFAKKIPGVSSIMKMGKMGLSKMPSLDNMIESTAKHYINANIKNTVDMSERILQKSLGEENIKRVAKNVWSSIENEKLDLAKRYVKPEDIDQASKMSREIWLDIRKLPALKSIFLFVVDELVSYLKTQSVTAWFDQLGGDTELLKQELQLNLEILLKDALDSGYLEERIRANLAPFYDSDAVKDILD